MDALIKAATKAVTRGTAIEFFLLSCSGFFCEFDEVINNAFIAFVMVYVIFPWAVTRFA